MLSIIIADGLVIRHSPNIKLVAVIVNYSAQAFWRLDTTRLRALFRIFHILLVLVHVVEHNYLLFMIADTAFNLVIHRQCLLLPTIFQALTKAHTRIRTLIQFQFFIGQINFARQRDAVAYFGRQIS